MNAYKLEIYWVILEKEGGDIRRQKTASLCEI